MTDNADTNTDRSDSGANEVLDESRITSDTEERSEFTIDELAAVTGVPSRTIRFYQAKGVLPAPRKRGRVAIYNESHIERLKLVADLQDRGLRLRAVRDLLQRTELDGSSVQRWLGLEQQLKDWSEDAPRLVSGGELKEIIGDQPSGVISRLIRLKIVEPHGEGLETRFLVKSPSLLSIAMKLEQAGIDLETAVSMYGILQRRLSRAADEVVAYAAENVGKGFGKSANPDDLKLAIDALFTGSSCTEAVRVIFAREIDRAVGALLKKGLAGKRLGRRLRRRGERAVSLLGGPSRNE